MKTMPLSEVKTKLSELVNAVERRDEVVSITRNGKPVAMIVEQRGVRKLARDCGYYEGCQLYEGDPQGNKITEASKEKLYAR
jgi:prevent-host-death family protein